MNDKLIVQFGGEERELFMSYGLLTRLTTLMNVQSDVSNAFGQDAITRDMVILECLIKRGKYGFLELKPDEEFSFDNYDFTVDQAEAIFNWATEHVSDFFVRRLEAGQKTMAPVLEKLQNLMPSISGTAPSASPSPSAGPSE